MGKAVQCPSCGRKHRVSVLPDAPTFHCDGCGQSLKVPAQFRPSMMASSPRVRPSDSARPDSTAVRPNRPAAAAAPVAARAPAAPSAPAASRPPRTARPPAGAVPDERTVALPLRILVWAIALPLGLIATLWMARITGWLSGDRLVDVFTETGNTRYLRVIAIAPVWALFTTLFLTLFVEGGRALARRRAEKRADAGDAARGSERGEPDAYDPVDARTPGGARRTGVGQRSRRPAAQRGGP
jgi:hypothetical protein